METISRGLLTFLLNSLWQVPLAAGVAAVACRLMHKGPARDRHAVWVAALVAAILLPLASVHTRQPRPTQFASSLPPARVIAAQHAPVEPPPAPLPPKVSRNIDLAETPAEFLLGAYFLFVLFRLKKLVWAVIRTVQIRRTAQAKAMPELIERVARYCQEALGLSRIKLLFSAHVSGPVTAGRAIILPESLRGEQSDDVLTSAIGHEMAHIARRDFAGILLYEVLYLPVSFHPAAWLIHRGIERTREMACDEMVAQRLMDAGVYARSILSIAAAMTALPRPGYTLGVFDGDILEERIRRLLERPATNLKRARLLLVTGLSALALCAVVASRVAITARAQGAADGVIKQGESALKHGDNKAASDLFATAVQLEPSNLKAKLFLASALLAQSGADAASQRVADARQQYLDALARDLRNRQAFDGIVLLYSNTGQFPEGREWVLKAIQANATDELAYYMAGFLDWSIVIPDYFRAGLAAEMWTEHPGIIPDVGLRLRIRSQHMTRIQEGINMLQTALQLDPNSSDAMAYMYMFTRMRASLVDSREESAELVAQADVWKAQALEAKRKRAQNPQIVDPIGARFGWDSAENAAGRVLGVSPQH